MVNSIVKDFLDQLIDGATPEKPTWNMEVLIKGRPAYWNYIDGCMIKAVLAMYKASKEQKYLDFADNYVDFFISDNGDILKYSQDEYNCDHINGGKNLIDLYRITGKAKYKKAIDLLYGQLKKHPRTSRQSFWHKKIYPNQVWLDGLYMVQPFYMEYENLFNENRNYRDIIHQFENARKFMKDERTGLLYHGYDESRQMFWCNKITGNSPNFWTRSLGWYTMALVDTIEKTDERLFNEYMLLQEWLKEIIDDLLKYKNNNMFYQVTDKPGEEGNYMETSGTCAIAYSILKGAKNGYLPSYYFDIGVDIFNTVVTKKLEKDENGYILNDICLVAGLGGMAGMGSYEQRDGSYEYYISEPVVKNDAKGVAPLIFAYSEICAVEGGKAL